jgi:hypothetical protein
LTDKSNKRFMFPMPSADQFASVMSRLGVGEGTGSSSATGWLTSGPLGCGGCSAPSDSATPPYSTADGPSGQPKDGHHRPRPLPATRQVRGSVPA